MLRLRIFSQLIFNHEICGDTRVQFEPDPETPGSLSELSRSLAMTSGSSDRLFLGPGYRRKHHLREKNIAGPTERPAMRTHW